MRQKAVVLDTEQNIATIRVLRSSMCEGCAQRGSHASCACGELLGANRVMTAKALNEIGAQPGDDVEIETESSVVLGYAALVFLLPVAAFFLLYALADSLSASEYVPWIVAAAGFLCSFLPAILVDRKKHGKAPQIRIVSRIVHDPDGSYEDIE